MMKKILMLVLSFLLLIDLPAQQKEVKRDTDSWTILVSYTIPGKASGLAWDGEYLYSGLYSAPGDDNLIYKIDPDDGSYTLQCEGPFEKCYGLTYDGSSGNLWTTDHPSANLPAQAIEFEMDGDFVSDFDLPETYFSGIAYDAGNFWTTCYYDPDGEVYKLDGSGNILDQFPTPGEQPWDICLEGNDLWIADYNDNMLYKIDQDGDLLESHASENVKPSGIVFDGTYLWYVDGGLQVDSKLYKIDLGGSGNPDINVPVTEHNYGIVTVNTTATWACLVQNNGSAALQVTYGDISGEGAEYVDWPEGTSFTIDANSSQTIYINYTPGKEGTLDAYATLESNDPVTPEVELHMLGTAVNSGPYLYLETDSIGFGEVRVGAYTRWELEVQNKGDQTLEITDISSADPDYFFPDDRDTLPISLEPLESTQLGIWFAPGDETDYATTLSITSNHTGQNPYAFSATGSGLLKDWPIGEVFWEYQIVDLIDGSPKSINQIPDVTGDGVDDVIIASEDDYIRCFNGNASGTGDVIWEREIYAGSVYQQNCTYITDDIDGDGYNDVIAGTAWGDRSILALSGYSGEVLWKHETHEYGDGGWVYQVDGRYDYNGDDFPDVLACTGDDSGDTGPKRVYCLDGKNGESIWETPLGGPVFSVIGVEDFTGDGQPDAVAGASNEGETEGSFYGIDGANGDDKWEFVTQGMTVWALEQIDDIDNSGTKDIVAGVSNGNIYYMDPKSLLIIYNGGIGSNTVVRFEVLEDISRDGYRDVLVASAANRSIVLDGESGGYLINETIDDKSWVVDGIADISGDNVNDFIIGSLFSNNYIYFIESEEGSVLYKENYSSPLDAIKSINDINGDWSMEMVAGGRSGKVICYSGGMNSAVGTPEGEISGSDRMNIHTYPNPFSKETTIRFDLKESAHVRIQVFNQQGMMVAQLADEEMPKGNHTLKWPSSMTAQLANGIYFCNIIAGKSVYNTKLILSK
jgi:hypothetical protein